MNKLIKITSLITMAVVTWKVVRIERRLKPQNIVLKINGRRIAEGMLDSVLKSDEQFIEKLLDENSFIDSSHLENINPAFLEKLMRKQ